jgi:4-hydroxy-3-polyprenylbenzoate decarboxylase
MQDVVEFLKEHGDLKVIDTPLDVELEIPHVAYIEVKKDNSRPILFTKPVNRAKGIEYDAPVLMNIFANKDITRKIFAKEPDSIGKAIDDLMKFKPPKGLLQKLKMLPKLLELKSVFPKRLKGRGESQDVVIKGLEVI